MQRTLSQLNKLRGVQGSLLVGTDGIVIVSDLQVDINEQAFGAVASSVLSALGRALDRMALGEFRRYVVSGKSARIAMYRVGPTILLLLLDKEANLGLITVEIRGAVTELEKKISL